MLNGKTALIAGGTAGIGLAVAEQYRRLGADVVVGGRRAQVGDRSVVLDVADEDSFVAALEAAREQLGDLDVLVLNAGVGHAPRPLAQTGTNAARRVIETNLLGTFLGLKHGPAHMADGGSVIITSSISAVTGTGFEGVYGATKAAVSALARSGAIDLGPRGIRVNAVQPGPTWTDMNAMPEGLLEITAPLGRKATVEDQVGIYVYLASDASRFITGQAISVDGGVTAGYSQALMEKLMGAVLA
jgi:NAD(P)-dependent dehydrogenase (short-subunit alcohol dehydrogenase family)